MRVRWRWRAAGRAVDVDPVAELFRKPQATATDLSGVGPRRTDFGCQAGSAVSYSDREGDGAAGDRDGGAAVAVHEGVGGNLAERDREQFDAVGRQADVGAGICQKAPDPGKVVSPAHLA